MNLNSRSYNSKIYWARVRFFFEKSIKDMYLCKNTKGEGTVRL